MCVFVLQLARWDRWLGVTATHTSVPPTTAERGAGRVGERLVDAG